MPDVWRERPDSEGKLSTDHVIGEMARAQWGLVTRRQLIGAGLAKSTIDRRLTSGRLIPLHRGVYAVGHRRLRREGFWLAAVLAVPGSVLSHRDAAGLHALRPANHARVDVATSGHAAAHKGIRVHRTRTLHADDVTNISGIPVTTVARTLVDLAAVVPLDHLAKAIKEAENQRKLDSTAIQASLHRTRTRRGPGHAALKQALSEHASLATTLTRSILEAGFQRLIQQHGLPKPHTNVHIEGMEVDACWLQARLVVELDGWAHHSNRQAFQRDRERDVRLQLAGYRVLRFTHHDVTRHPLHVAVAVRQALAP